MALPRWMILSAAFWAAGGCVTAAVPPVPAAAVEARGVADTRAILTAVAAHLRADFADGRGFSDVDSIMVSPFGTGTAETEMLRRELGGAMIGSLESVQRDCRPLVGCELTVKRWLEVGHPVLHPDGTAVVRVHDVHRTPTSTRTRTSASVYELHLGRTGDGWEVTSSRGILQT